MSNTKDLPGGGDTSLFHKCKTHNNHLASALRLFRNADIYKNKYKHPRALSLQFEDHKRGI